MDYEEVVYDESDSDKESEPETVEPTFEPSFKHHEHIEKERPNERNDNMVYVKKFLAGIKNEEILITYANKISKLNSPLLKEVVEKKIKTFTLEQYRYYRFLKHLEVQCQKGGV